jgi:transposase
MRGRGTGLLEKLRKSPEMFLGVMLAFLKDEYGVNIAISTISSALSSVGWSKKTVRRVAQERNADLCD